MSQSKTRHTLSETWAEHITAWKQSGQNQKVFCAEHGLSYHQFGYWRRRLSASTATVESNFVPVRPPVTNFSGLALVLPNGLVIHGIAADNLSLVGQLLRQL